MNWSQGIELVKNRLASAHGTFETSEGGYARMTRGEGAQVVDTALEQVTKAGLGWDWFPVALAVLGYRKAGDSLPPIEQLVAQLVDDDQCAYVWAALEFLAEQLDDKGVPFSMPSPPPAADTLGVLVTATWTEMQQRRAAGADPKWTGVEPMPWSGLTGGASTPSSAPSKPSASSDAGAAPAAPAPSGPIADHAGDVILFIGTLWGLSRLIDAISGDRRRRY